MTEMFNAYMDEPLAIRKDVMNYVNMIIGIDAENVGADKMWKYKDPQTGKLKALKIDERFINSVEERLGLKTEEQRETFRTSIRKIYGQKISVDPDYDFMDQSEHNYDNGYNPSQLAALGPVFHGIRARPAPESMIKGALIGEPEKKCDIVKRHVRIFEVIQRQVFS